MSFQKRGNNPGGWKGGGKSFGDKKPWEHGGGRGGFDSRGFEKPEMHRATCAQCNQSCEVPFRPNGSRPVYCSNCFKREDDRGGSREFTRNDDSHNKPSFKPTYTAPGSTAAAPDNKTLEQLKKQVETINFKLDAIIEALSQIIPEDDEFEDEDGDEAEIVEIKAPKKTTKGKAPKKAKK